MVGGPGLRFALEAAFLVVLAIAAGLAELSPTTIVLVMAAAWLLVAVIEWLAWRETAPLTRVVREEPTPVEPVQREARRGRRFWRRREPEPVEPEPVPPSVAPPAPPPAAPPAPVQPRSGEDTQDLGPSPDPPAAMRADERTGT
jgi:hypothetical protein